MQIREYFDSQSGDFDFLWKLQMFVGVLVVLMGVMVAVFPEIIVALVAAAIIMVGAGLIGSAWRMRKLQQRSRGVAYVEHFEW